MSKSKSELSRTVPLQTLREHRRFTATVKATPEECVALAKRYGVTEVRFLESEIALKTAGPELIRFTGTVKAEIVQPCGASLEPVTQTIKEEHEELLTTSAALITPIDELTAPDDNSPTELIEGDTVDYGEIAAQIVALYIDPFPRKDGPDLVAHIEHSHNPFAALNTLKKSDGSANDPAND